MAEHLVRYPLSDRWPAAAAVLAARHADLIAAPFRDPAFYAVVGTEEADEKRGRPWHQPLHRDGPRVALAFWAALHSCLGTGRLTPILRRTGARGAPVEITFRLDKSAAGRPDAAFETEICGLAGTRPEVPAAEVLEILGRALRDPAAWLRRTLERSPDWRDSLLGAVTLTECALHAYLDDSSDQSNLEPLVDTLDAAIVGALKNA